MTAVAKAAQWAPRWRVLHPPRLPFTLVLQAARRESPIFTSQPSRHFSVSQKPARQHGDKAPSGDNGSELPAFSLQGLGISKNMKLALIGILGIFGTMETCMYGKWIWQWCRGQADHEQASKPVSD